MTLNISAVAGYPLKQVSLLNAAQLRVTLYYKGKPWTQEQYFPILCRLIRARRSVRKKHSRANYDSGNVSDFLISLNRIVLLNLN